MIIILGLVLLVLAAVVAIAGIFTNTGSAHALSPAFSIFGHHMTGSTGTLFLFGIVVGAVAMLGLGLLLIGARRTLRRAGEARHGLRESHREQAAVRKDRDAVTDQRQREDPISRQERVRQDRSSVQLAGTSGSGASKGDGEVASHHRWPHLLGRHPAHQ